LRRGSTTGDRHGSKGKHHVKFDEAWDFKRVEQKMAQIEGFVHVERISMLMGS
jgi:hypothetical protein